MKKLLWVSLVAACCLLGCSSQQVYNGVMQNRQHACLHELPQEQQACLRRYETSYDDYVEQRQAVLDDQR